MNEKVICASCGATVRPGNYCSSCGVALSPRLPFPPPAQKKPDCADEELAGLTLLVDFCRRTVATIGGDGYQEQVLYRRGDDEYEVHFFWNDAVHDAYRASKELLDEAMEFIRAQRFADFEGKRGPGLMGGIVSLKFFDGERLIRVSSDNLEPEHLNALHQVSAILRKCMTEENKL